MTVLDNTQRPKAIVLDFMNQFRIIEWSGL